MFRLLKAEIKKIFLKPSIFVVTGLVVLMLAVSTFIYKPATKDEEYIKYSLDATATVSDYYNHFDTSSSYYARMSIDNLIVQAETYLDYYQSNNNAIDDLKTSWADVKAKYDGTTNNDYKSAYNRWLRDQDESSKNDLNTKKTQLNQALTGFLEKYMAYINDETVPFLMTTSPDINYEIYNLNLLPMKALLSKTGSELEIEDIDGYITRNIDNAEYFTNVLNQLEKLIPFTPNEEYVNSLYDYITEASNRNATLLEQIKDYEKDFRYSREVENIDEFKSMLLDYYLNADYAKKIVVDGVNISGLSKYTAMDITKFKSFENANLYEMKERYTKYKYCFDNNTYLYNFADPFSVAQPSNTELNGFDYSYFALKLCTFFITIYIVALAASTIAGEQSAGTLKLLAIRPFGRHKILSAKILATMIVGLILLLVSSIATIVVGGITYGFATLPILAVFNASVAFTISPVLLYIIAILTMAIEIVFYAMISVFISTVFKSNIAAVAISLLLFFVSLVLNIIAVNIPWLGLIPFVNVNWFKYFGSAFVTNLSNRNLIQSILTPSVFAGSTFLSSILIYTITFTLLDIATHIVFKRRDIK